MYLKRLEIHGFKSFAAKAVLEFSQGIIAIVGPNGSGKSNVADAIRWVLGEQSPKLMRGKKSDDVIFAGSDKKGRMGFCEVFATFDNRDRRIPVDSAEVAIGRRIDRSGESEYLINGNRVRLLDVVDLVLKSNIGTSRYTVIGQGTIDQMILSGPAEVKNLLDEASGVKGYYMRREKTLRRLEQTAQNLMRAEDLIKEIEPRLKSLRRQAKRMEARAEVETELKVLQRELFGATYWTLKGTLDGYRQELDRLDSLKVKLEGESAAFRARAEELERGGGKHSEAVKGIQRELSALQQQKNRLLEDMSLVRGKMQSLKTASSGDAATLQVELHQKQQKFLELKAAAESAEQRRAAAQAALERERASLQGLSEKLEQLHGALQSPAAVDWALFDRELVQLEEAGERFWVEVEHAQDLTTLKRTAAELRAHFSRFVAMAKERVSEPERNLAELQGQLKAALERKEALQQAISAFEVELSKAHLELEFLARQAETAAQDQRHVELELKKAQSASPDDFLKELIAEEARIQRDVEAVGREAERLERLASEALAKDSERTEQLKVTEAAFRKAQDDLSKVKDRISELSVEKARFDTQVEVLIAEATQALGQEGLVAIRLEPIQRTTEGLEEKIVKLKGQLEVIGGIDELTMQEYRETESRYANLTAQVEDLRRGMQDLKSVMDELDVHIKQKFSEAFHRINEKFEYYFRVLFNGGRAYLSQIKAQGEEPAEATDQAEGSAEAEGEEAAGQLRPEEKVVRRYSKGPSDVVGIDIKATPPGKKLATIQALSGGERALTSIALLCSLLTCFPSPFVVLDEVDAALDDANTIRFGQILGTLAHQTQFITITHNRETMAQSHILYGVTMGDDGISKLLSVKLEQAKAYAK